MSTFGQMQSRIADELGGRTDLLVPSSGMSLSPIQLAIQDAIQFWENDRFFFNEDRVAGAFSTIVGQEFYTVADWADIPNLLHIDKLSILISGNRYFMTPRTEQWMEDISINPSWSGQPVDYSYYDFRLRFYPIPNGVYPVNVLRTFQLAALSSSNDSTIWTNEAEQLIRLTAKQYIYRDTILDDGKSASMERGAQAQFSSLKGATFRRSATLKFQPTQF